MSRAKQLRLNTPTIMFSSSRTMAAKKLRVPKALTVRAAQGQPVISDITAAALSYENSCINNFKCELFHA
jgi:hypothetical protein